MRVERPLSETCGAGPREKGAILSRMSNEEATHSAAMAVLNRLGGAAGDRTVAALASAAARLLRPYVAQEALRDIRSSRSSNWPLTTAVYRHPCRRKLKASSAVRNFGT